MGRLRTFFSALALVCVLFQPAAAFAAQVFNSSDSTMSCCRTKRSCCCRKDGKRASLAWKAAASCKQTCAQSIGLIQPGAALKPTVSASATALVPVTGVVVSPAAGSASSAYLAFLYQRPPPSLS